MSGFWKYAQAEPDVVAIVDADTRRGPALRRGRVTLGVIVHGDSTVRGHGPGQEVLVIGKERVNIDRIDPVGNYAVRLVFDDGHDSGIYSWGFLYDLGVNMVANRARYADRLRGAESN
jgi:DUF971 family protein